VSGAVAERIAADGDLAHWITGIVIDVLLPDGSVEHGLMAPQGHVAARQAYPPPQSDEEIETEVAEILAGRGLTPVEVRILHPLGPAPRIIASAPLDVLAGQVNDLLAELSGDRERYEGLYVELRTPEGIPLMCTGSSRRLFGGMLWIDPDVEELLGGPPHSTIPPPPPTS
jgi:hypothetical protein